MNKRVYYLLPYNVNQNLIEADAYIAFSKAIFELLASNKLVELQGEPFKFDCPLAVKENGQVLKVPFEGKQRDIIGLSVRTHSNEKFQLTAWSKGSVDFTNVFEHIFETTKKENQSPIFTIVSKGSKVIRITSSVAAFFYKNGIKQLKK